jgi:hypothetical protein
MYVKSSSYFTAHDDGPNESENKSTRADTFRKLWDEYSDFTSKSGKVFSIAEQEHIWSPDNVALKNGDAPLALQQLIKEDVYIS